MAASQAKVCKGFIEKFSGGALAPKRFVRLNDLLVRLNDLLRLNDLRTQSIAASRQRCGRNRTSMRRFVQCITTRVQGTITHDCRANDSMQV